jgi:hypothetical protein
MLHRRLTALLVWARCCHFGRAVREVTLRLAGVDSSFGQTQCALANPRVLPASATIDPKRLRLDHLPNERGAVTLTSWSVRSCPRPSSVGHNRSLNVNEGPFRDKDTPSHTGALPRTSHKRNDLRRFEPF